MLSHLKAEAIKLRKAGKSYGEIASLLGVSSKGTLSHWLSSVNLNKRATELIQRKKEKTLIMAQLAARKKNRELREVILQNIRENVRVIKARLENNINSMKLALAFLYLGEGSKWRSHSGLQLGSSDPDIIELYLTLLDLCYKVDRKGLHCYICYRADQDVEKLKGFWSRKTKIPLKNFYQSSPDKRTIGKPTKNKDYKGVCVVSGGSANIQLELEMMPKIVVMGL